MMRHLRWAIGLLIGGIAFYVAVAGVDWQDVGSALADANYALLIGAVPILLALYVMRAQRWRLLFYPDTHVRLLSTFGSLSIGYMMSLLLPVQLGEVARVYELGERENIRKARVLSTVAVERMLDVFVLLAILALLIPFVDLPQAAFVTAALFLAIFVALAIVVAVSVLDRARVEGWAEKLSAPLPARGREAVCGLSHSLLDGLSALSSPRIWVQVSAWTVLSWLTSAAIIYMVLRAMSLDVPVAAAPFLLVATSFGFFIPSSPGAVGVYHAISIASLTIVFSVDREPATSYALVAYALYVIPPTILGGYFFWWHHLAGRQIRPPAEEQVAAPGGSVDRSVEQGSTTQGEPPQPS